MFDGPTGRGKVAYGPWVDSFRWDLFLTLTYRMAPSSRTSLKHFHRLLDSLRRRGFPDLGYFVGSETGPNGGREHLHALLYTGRRSAYPTEGKTQAVGRAAFSARSWWGTYYGFAKVSEIKSGRKASRYAAKYCSKELAEWDIGGNIECQAMDSETSDRGRSPALR